MMPMIAGNCHRSRTDMHAASNTGGGDTFSESVAVSDGTVVIGARFEDSAATGVNGDQADNSADGAGAVHVFAGPGTRLYLPLLKR